MRIITHDDGRCLTLRLVGELDHAAAQTVMPGIEDAVEEYLPRRCVLDLTGVSFMDSSGIAVILKTDRLLRQTGGALALSGVPGQVRLLPACTDCRENNPLPLVLIQLRIVFLVDLLIRHSVPLLSALPSRKPHTLLDDLHSICECLCKSAVQALAPVSG